LLAAVEIDGGNALTGFQKRDSDVQGGGGLARPALLVAQHDNMCRAGLTLTSLHQHDSTPTDIFKSRKASVK
jgi:hypothetical protein